MVRSLNHGFHAPYRWRVLAAAVVALGCGPAAAEPSTKAPAAQAPVSTVQADKSNKKQAEPAPGEKWVRVLSDAKGKPLAMQTAIVR
jgi:hypothetical protein